MSLISSRGGKGGGCGFHDYCQGPKFNDICG